jgi:hypothetical protein
MQTWQHPLVAEPSRRSRGGIRIVYTQMFAGVTGPKATTEPGQVDPTVSERERCIEIATRSAETIAAALACR